MNNVQTASCSSLVPAFCPLDVCNGLHLVPRIFVTNCILSFPLSLEEESDDEKYKTPDCSVEMAISRLRHLSDDERKLLSPEVDETTILKENCFFPVVCYTRVY